MSKFDLGEIDQVEASYEEEKGEAEKTATETKEALDYLAAVRAKIVAAAKDRELTKRLQPLADKAAAFLNECRQTSTGLTKRAVSQAVIDYELSKEIKAQSDLIRLLDGLARLGLLTVATENGHIVAYGKNYVVPQESLLDEVDIAGIRTKVAKIINDLRYQTKTMSRSDVLDISRGIPGVYVLFVPSQEGRAGGVLTLLLNEAGFIRPTDASGKIEAAVREAMSLGVMIRHTTLNDKEAPLSNDPDFEKRKKFQLLWHLIIRGLRDAQWNRNALATPGLIDPEAFFLRGEPGLCLVSIGETWQWKEQVDGETQPKIIWISDPKMIVERTIADGVRKIRIVSMVERLEKFLAGCTQHEEGDRFGGLPIRFGAILRAAYKKAQAEAGHRAKYAPDVSVPVSAPHTDNATPDTHRAIVRTEDQALLDTTIPVDDYYDDDQPDDLPDPDDQRRRTKRSRQLVSSGNGRRPR